MAVNKLTVNFISKALVPEFTDAERIGVPPCEGQYAGHLPVSLQVLETVRAVLREESYSVGNAGEDQLGAVVVATILLCGQHCPILRTNIKKILWSSPRHGDLAVHIMGSLLSNQFVV